MESKRTKLTPERRKRANERQNLKYASDPEHRKLRIRLETERRQTPLGMIQSRLRINNHEARKKGFAECKTSAHTILNAFNHKCDLCNFESEIKKLVIDHSHVSGIFRGWICSSCNSGLGYFKDSKEKLALAISYLEKFGDAQCC